MSQKPKFSRAHEGLGDQFSDPVEAAVFPQHVLRYRNDAAAQSVGLHGLKQEMITNIYWLKKTNLKIKFMLKYLNSLNY